MMTYSEAIAWWYSRIDFERKLPKPGDLKLDRMRAILRLLGDPHERMRIVHVAGTKGKGSTSAMLDSVLRAAGYRVGLFTSPHLSDVSERFQVNGSSISPDEMAARLTEIATAVRPLEQAGDPLLMPTFFEIGTALGFLHFNCRGVEIAIMEVGLGGRFDSTNVCLPLISVITNISFDHMAMLGDKLALIAREKAGIIKPRRPVITTAEAPEALAVITRIAREQHAPITALGRDFHYQYLPGALLEPSARGDDQKPRVQVVTHRQTWPWMELGLFGQHQSANAAGVVAVVEQMRAEGIPIDDTAVRRGLANVRWPARLEVVGHRPLILLDCAHNVASAQALVETIDDSFLVHGSKRLILAVSSDKQVAEMLQVLGPKFDHFHLSAYANNPRCLMPDKVAEMLRTVRPMASITIHASAPEALQAARTASGTDDLIAISGSVFLAGELRPLLSI
ncbi:MAG: bifunctional folylpolyglutamate synthase/dihydrofolate synthase [Planctomycetes bacterium]|nr:bifunctional folylpolyglutamate synthase/dihydrofolate synthase [Planctomycetota bacterium]